MSKSRIIYGFHALSSRIRHHTQTIQQIYVDATRQDARAKDLLVLIQSAGLQVHAVPAQRLAGLCGTTHHQGVVAQVLDITLQTDLDELVVSAGPALLLLILDGIQDPHNLGACLRVADAMGVHAVVAPRDRSASLSATVSKVASGAAETVPYIPVTNLARTLRELKDHAVWVVGTDDEAPVQLAQVQLEGPVAWVLGAEGSGLRRLTRESCDQLVRIPMFGTVGSLNVSVAAGICLYETRRRRPAPMPLEGPAPVFFK